MSKFSIDAVLSCPTLPSLPAVAAKLIELTGDPDVQISEIAKTVQQDQALAGKVLKTVNSSYYGLSNRCGSIDRAMGYLGLNTVKSLVLGFSLVETTKNIDEGGFDMVAHWRRTLMGATASRILAQQFRLSDKDEVFSAALFQDMGMLAIFTCLKDQYIEVIQGINHTDVQNAETEAFGFHHAEVGAQLAQKWKLPSEIIDAIRFHHTPESATTGDIEMIRAVALGTQVAEALSVENPAASMRKIEREVQNWFPGQKFDIQTLFESVNEAAKELSTLFDTEIGDLKDVQQLMSAAQERGLEHQISMQRQTENLEKQAFTDGLTSVPNRKEFDKILASAFDDFTQNGKDFAVLFLDADKFKSVNDTHGHAVGDAVLIELAKRTTDVVADNGTVCRYGGEEFAIILPGSNVLQAAMLGERVRAEIANEAFDIRALDEGPDELPISVSVGVSAVDAGSADRLSKAEQIVVEADSGVYAAKAAGRNNVQVWSEKSNESLPATKPSTPSTVPEGDGTIRKLVLVEDDALAATLVLTLFNRKMNIEIQWIKDGSEACEYFKECSEKSERPCDLVICDLKLPGCSGFEVYEKFQSYGLANSIGFVVLTSDECDETTQQSSSLGISNCISKSDFSKNIGHWIGVLSGGPSGSAAA